jgi:hypothetical protein
MPAMKTYLLTIDFIQIFDPIWKGLPIAKPKKSDEKRQFSDILPFSR